MWNIGMFVFLCLWCIQIISVYICTVYASSLVFVSGCVYTPCVDVLCVPLPVCSCPFGQDDQPSLWRECLWVTGQGRV